jgi:hypothetical protein
MKRKKLQSRVGTNWEWLYGYCKQRPFFNFYVLFVESADFEKIASVFFFCFLCSMCAWFSPCQVLIAIFFVWKWASRPSLPDFFVTETHKLCNTCSIQEWAQSTRRQSSSIFAEKKEDHEWYSWNFGATSTVVRCAFPSWQVSALTILIRDLEGFLLLESNWCTCFQVIYMAMPFE